MDCLYDYFELLLKSCSGEEIEKQLEYVFVRFVEYRNGYKYAPINNNPW